MPEIELPRPVFVISDGTGDTGEKMVRAALHQFKGYLVHLRVFPNIVEREQLERLIIRAAREEALLFTTLVSQEMRAAAREISATGRFRRTSAKRFPASCPTRSLCSCRTAARTRTPSRENARAVSGDRPGTENHWVVTAKRSLRPA